MKIEEYSFPDDLYYHKEHFWAKVEGDVVTIGTTDFAQKLAGQVVYIELPSAGKAVEQGQTLWLHGIWEMGGKNLLASVSGKIEAINSELEDTPELINESPYEKRLDV